MNMKLIWVGWNSIWKTNYGLHSDILVWLQKIRNMNLKRIRIYHVFPKRERNLFLNAALILPFKMHLGIRKFVKNFQKSIKSIKRKSGLWDKDSLHTHDAFWVRFMFVSCRKTYFIPRIDQCISRMGSHLALPSYKVKFLSPLVQCQNDFPIPVR